MSSTRNMLPMERPADEEDEEDLSDDEDADDLGVSSLKIGGGGENAHFTTIIREMVTTGYAEGHPADSLLMEVKGCKFAQNKVCVAIPGAVHCRSNSNSVRLLFSPTPTVWRVCCPASCTSRWKPLTRVASSKRPTFSRSGSPCRPPRRAGGPS